MDQTHQAIRIQQSSASARQSESWRDNAKYMYLYVIGSIMTGIMPLLFGRLVIEKRLNVLEMGQLATWELLAMGAAATLSGIWFRERRTRAAAFAAAALLLAANLLSIYAVGAWLVLARIVAGIQGGVLAQIGVSWIARSSKPAHGASEFVFALGCAQLAFGAALAAILPRFGSTGGFLLISATVLIAVFTSLRVARPPEATRGYRAVSVPPLSGWFALISTFLYLCFIFAVTTYTVPLATEKGLSLRDGDAAVVASLIGQMAGAGGSVWLARRFTWFSVSSFLSIGCFCALVVLWITKSSAAFIAVSLYLGFGPMATIAFQIPFAVDADVSGRTPNLVPAAQLFGSAAGPFVATLGVYGASVRDTIWVGALCLFASSMLLVLARWRILPSDKQRLAP